MDSLKIRNKTRKKLDITRKKKMKTLTLTF